MTVFLIYRSIESHRISSRSVLPPSFRNPTTCIRVSYSVPIQPSICSGKPSRPSRPSKAKHGQATSSPDPETRSLPDSTPKILFDFFDFLSNPVSIRLSAKIKVQLFITAECKPPATCCKKSHERGYCHAEYRAHRACTSVIFAV